MPISNDINREAMKNLRDAVFMARVPYEQIGEHVGCNRKTVSRLLHKPDLPVGTFFKIAEAIGADPLKLLKEAHSQASTAQRLPDSGEEE